MKKKISLVFCVIAVSLWFSACPKNSKLAQSKQKQSPSKQVAKAPVNQERIKEKLEEEIAEMRERREAHERYDQPREVEINMAVEVRWVNRKGDLLNQANSVPVPADLVLLSASGNLVHGRLPHGSWVPHLAHETA